MWMAVTFVTWSTRWISFFFSFVDDDGVATIFFTTTDHKDYSNHFNVHEIKWLESGRQQKKREIEKKPNLNLIEWFVQLQVMHSAEVKAVAWFSFRLLRSDIYVMLMLYYREYHICIQSYWSSYRYCGTKKHLHSLICYNVYVRRSFCRDISHSELFSSLNIFTNQSMFTAAVLYFDHHTNIWTELLKFHDLISCFLCTY